jgi:hypothetical protein
MKRMLWAKHDLVNSIFFPAMSAASFTAATQKNFN